MYLLIEVEVFVQRASKERNVGADEEVYEIRKHRPILHVTVDHIFLKLQNVEAREPREPRDLIHQLKFSQFHSTTFFYFE